MIIGRNERNPENLNNPFGGEGNLELDHLLKSPLCPTNMNMFAVATLEPGSTIGYHQHTGESECYYIISGKGQYNDDGCTRRLVPGDVTFTASGHSHSLKNIGDEDLVFVAVITKE